MFACSSMRAVAWMAKCFSKRRVFLILHLSYKCKRRLNLPTRPPTMDPVIAWTKIRGEYKRIAVQIIRDVQIPFVPKTWLGARITPEGILSQTSSSSDCFKRIGDGVTSLFILWELVELLNIFFTFNSPVLWFLSPEVSIPPCTEKLLSCIGESFMLLIWYTSSGLYLAAKPLSKYRSRITWNGAFSKGNSSFDAKSPFKPFQMITLSNQQHNIMLHSTLHIIDLSLTILQSTRVVLFVCLVFPKFLQSHKRWLKN